MPARIKQNESQQGCPTPASRGIRPSSGLVFTTSSVFSLSSCVRGLLVCWLWLWLPEDPHWAEPASGGLDHTFHWSQLSDGELHLLSEAGWAHHRPANAGAHNYCLTDYYGVYSCPYTQQMTVWHSLLHRLRPKGVLPSDEDVAAANQHSAHPENRSDPPPPPMTHTHTHITLIKFNRPCESWCIHQVYQWPYRVGNKD